MTPTRRCVFGIIMGLLLWATATCGPPASQVPTAMPSSPPAGTTASPESGYIDTHMHIDGLYRSGNTLVRDHPAAAANLVALMDPYGVAQAVIVVVPTHTGQDGEADYQDARRGVSAYPDRLRLMAGGATLNPIVEATDPSAVTPELRAEFEAKAEQLVAEGAIGFGEMIAFHLCLSSSHAFIEAAPDHPLFLLLADVAARHNLPIDLHMEVVPEDMPTPANLLQACDQNPATLPATIPPFEQLLAHNRGAKIVWQHIGWDNTGYMTVDLLRRLLQDHPNLYLALKVEARPVQVASSEPMPNRISDQAGQIQPEWLELISDYPDRFMIGADEFVGVSTRATHGAESFTQTWAILSQLPPDLARQVGHDNAVRVYHLE